VLSKQLRPWSIISAPARRSRAYQL